MATSVKVGITTIIGYLVFIAGLIPILVKLLESGVQAVNLSGPERYSAIVSLVSLAITQIGRYAQAHAKIKQGGDS
jgi:hypothetical protein